MILTEFFTSELPILRLLLLRLLQYILCHFSIFIVKICVSAQMIFNVPELPMQAKKSN